WMFSDEYTQNPYPFLAQLREEQPVCRVETPDGPWTPGVWGGASVSGRGGEGSSPPQAPRSAGHH
ncbi:hypothetical protein ACWEWX_22555, partial [Streptomyces asiaticus]